MALMTSPIDPILKAQLIKLSMEFDCLGLATINTNIDVLHQLATSASKLVQMYRHSLTNFREYRTNISQLEEELKLKRNEISSLKEKIRHDQEEFNDQKISKSHQDRAMSALKLRLEECEDDLQRSQLHNKNREAEWAHKVRKLEVELDKFKGTSPEVFKNQDRTFVTMLAKYKVKENIYTNTIQQLQVNNDDLQKQILDLRDDILNMLLQNTLIDSTASQS